MNRYLIRILSLSVSLLLTVGLCAALPVDAAGPVAEIEVTGPVIPVSGKHPEPAGVEVSTSRVFIEEIGWKKEDGSFVQPHEVFYPDCTYQFQITLTCPVFEDMAEKVKVYLPDQPEISVSSVDEHHRIYVRCDYYVEPDPVPLHNVQLSDLVAAQRDASPDFSVSIPQGALYSVADSYWMNNTDNWMIWGNETFEPGKVYTHTVRLLPHKGYSFPEEGVIVSYDDKVVSVVPDPDGALSVNISYTIEKPYYKEIVNVSLNEPVHPEEGKKPDYYTEINDGYCTVSQVLWLDQNNHVMDPSETFEGGKTYYRVVILQANGGYKFASPTSVDYGTMESRTLFYPDIYSDHDDVLSAGQTFVAEKKPQVTTLSSLVLANIISPKQQETPSQGVTFEGNPSVRILNNEWKDDYGNTVNNHTGFEAGKSYERYFRIEAVNGSVFDSKVQVSIDGEKQTVSPVNNIIEVSRWYKVKEEKHIHQLTYVKGIEPTEEKMGTRPYYRCTCGKYFEDAKAEKEIKENISKWRLIPPLKPQQTPESQPQQTPESKPATDRIEWSDKTEQLTIKVPGNLPELKEILLDGKKLDQKQYTVDPATGLLIFSDEILASLQPQEHTLSFVYPDQTFDKILSITSLLQQHEVTAESGKSSPVPLIIACVAGAVAGAVIVAMMNKKKQNQKKQQ